ncbi:MAG: hypothetical protein KBA26_08575 [Candidatus Delongbacteria bacterium]|nr:hypothetical protein [Candidatus Delongbacteria bacterium]
MESMVELKGIINHSSLMNIPFAQHAVYEEQPQFVELALKQFLIPNE